MEILDDAYWNKRYFTQQTGWDIGQPSTPLKIYIDSLADKNQHILIPGCGNAYEAKYLLEKGFKNITLIDIAPQVTKQVTYKLSSYIEQGSLKMITGDFFNLAEDVDLILEQTFFCAINPKLRQLYAQKVYELLNPKGVLVGVLFNFTLTNDGPPFGGNEAEYLEYFSPLFDVKKLEPCYNSITPRNGIELFVKLVKF